MKQIAETLAPHRIILIRGRIDGNLQDIVCTAVELMSLTNPDPITLRIDSNGGHLDPGLHICDSLRFSRVPTKGVVVGVAGSTAFSILQACDVRLAYRNAQLFFHGFSTSRPIDNSQFESNLVQIQQKHKEFLDELSMRSKQPLAKLKKWSGEERTFSAQEAESLGFIDDILSPPPKR